MHAHTHIDGQVKNIMPQATHMMDNRGTRTTIIAAVTLSNHHSHIYTVRQKKEPIFF